MLNKKVKIVATLGPATNTKEKIAALAKRGVNVFRLNLSHQDGAAFEPIIKIIREVEKDFGAPLAIMADLAGPKIRIGKIKEGAVLHAGRTVKIVPGAIEGSEEVFSLNFPAILKNLQKGAEVYLADGVLKLRVEKNTKDGVFAKVLVGGPLISKKGFSAQGLIFGSFALSVKDKSDVKAMYELGVDAFAVSFVQAKRDIEAVRKLLPEKNRPLLIAKIETAEAVENIEGIIDVSDGVMVARGDLGLSVPMEQVPYIQRSLIRLALRKAKPVITATQMLESMIQNPLPTRAEVTDVTKAILDGTDAIMLSAETAVGSFPFEVVEMMTKIADASLDKVIRRDFPEEKSIADAVSASTVRTAQQIQAKLIIVFTQKGVTARRIARHKPTQPILALSPDPKTIRQLAFSWGTHPMIMKSLTDFDEMIEYAKKIAANNPVLKLKKGDAFVISAGVPFGHSGMTNLVLVEHV